MTIEDSAELQLRRKHVVRLETRMPTSEGAGAVTPRDLVRNSLRMRPDRIIVGEVRSGEALDMLQAMNTGHEGSLTTIHANDARDALSRLEMMVAMAGFDLPVHVVRHYIASAINVIVHLSRLKGGVRRVMRIVELVDLAAQRISTPRACFAFARPDWTARAARRAASMCRAMCRFFSSASASEGLSWTRNCSVQRVLETAP